jgi:hypothetical protein
MDRLGLQVLKAEFDADCAVAKSAALLAEERLHSGSPAGIEACAYQLARLYNIIEQMALRVARAFENHIDDSECWHLSLIRRLSIPIEGIRPALFGPELAASLQELRAFRHVVRHSYDLLLDPARLQTIELLDRHRERFFGAVAAAQGWSDSDQSSK